MPQYETRGWPQWDSGEMSPQIKSDPNEKKPWLRLWNLQHSQEEYYSITIVYNSSGFLEVFNIDKASEKRILEVLKKWCIK